MTKKMLLIALPCVVAMLISCTDSPEVIHDLNDANYNLVNQDSAAVDFPSDFEGNYLIIAYIYTHCPDICNITTAKMKNISNQLQDTANVQFVEITFDPGRDTPAVLHDYMQTFKLPERQFSMLTGKSGEIDRLLSSLDVEAEIAYRDTNSAGNATYTMNHTDRIAVMDPQGRVRFEYPGSVTPPDYIIEDLNKIRGAWYDLF